MASGAASRLGQGAPGTSNVPVHTMLVNVTGVVMVNEPALAVMVRTPWRFERSGALNTPKRLVEPPANDVPSTEKLTCWLSRRLPNASASVNVTVVAVVSSAGRLVGPATSDEPRLEAGPGTKVANVVPVTPPTMAVMFLVSA